MATLVFDVAVWGDHWCSINAAIEAARYGRRVILLSPQPHIGTPMTNGLGATDIGRYGARNLGTWTNFEWINLLTRMIGSSERQSRCSPSFGERAWSDLLRLYGVVVRVNVTLASVAVTSNVITSITLGDTHVVQASNYVDGSEDGDLAAMAGCAMFTGRESTAAYGESLAGYFPQPDTFKPLNTDNGSGGLIYGISPAPVGKVLGDEDLNTNQRYGWRLCITNERVNRLAWPKPAGYDPALFEWRKRSAGASFASDDFRPFLPSAWTMQGKVDLNNDTGEYSGEWPNATPARRTEITQLMYDEWAGWLWHCANEGSAGCQKFMSIWGLCRDEHIESTPLKRGWPFTFYRRGTRRLANPRYMMRQQDTQTDVTKATSIATGYYSLDCHSIRYVAVPGGYIHDGFGGLTEERQVVPYQIPYECMLTPDITNIIVPNCVGSTFVAYASMRIDYWKANMASVAGYAAAKATATSTPMHLLVVADLQTETVALGNVITPNVPA